MKYAKILKSPDNPAGMPLPSLLRQVHMELGELAMRLGDDRPTLAAIKVVMGLLIQGEGEAERAALDGLGIDGLRPPALMRR